MKADAHHEAVLNSGIMAFQSEPEPSKKIPNAPLNEDRQFTDRPLTYFTGILKQYNLLQANALIKPYTNLFVHFSGVLKVILRPRENPKTSHLRNAPNTTSDSPADFRVLKWTEYINDSGSVTLVGLTSSDQVVIVCRYPKRYNDYLSRIDIGDNVMGVGAISSESTGQGLLLDDCRPG